MYGDKGYRMSFTCDSYILAIVRTCSSVDLRLEKGQKIVMLCHVVPPRVLTSQFPVVDQLFRDGAAARNELHAYAFYTAGFYLEFSDRGL